MRKHIYIAYTGGTIGMIKDNAKNTLIPFNFDELLKTIPELKSDELDLKNMLNLETEQKYSVNTLPPQGLCLVEVKYEGFSHEVSGKYGCEI